MNSEVLTQLLDILAFLLVTPEVIGEDRLRSFRNYAQGRAILLRFLFGFIVFLCLVILFIFGFLALEILGPALTFTVDHHLMLLGMIVSAFCFLILVPAVSLPVLLVPIYLDSHIMPWLLRMTENLAVRGTLFLAGAACFLLARGISIWLAMHATVR